MSRTRQRLTHRLGAFSGPRGAPTAPIGKLGKAPGPLGRHSPACGPQLSRASLDFSLHRLPQQVCQAVNNLPCRTTTVMFPSQPTQQSCAELEKLGLAELRAHAQDACFHGESWVASAQESHLLVFGPCSSVSTNVMFSYAWKSYHLISRCLVHRYPVSAEGSLTSLQECHSSERRKEVPGDCGLLSSRIGPPGLAGSWRKTGAVQPPRYVWTHTNHCFSSTHFSASQAEQCLLLPVSD